MKIAVVAANGRAAQMIMISYYKQKVALRKIDVSS